MSEDGALLVPTAQGTPHRCHFPASFFFSPSSPVTHPTASSFLSLVTAVLVALRFIALLSFPHLMPRHPCDGWPSPSPSFSQAP